MKFYCIKCLRESLPTLNLDDNQLNLTMNGVDYPEEVNVNEIFLSESQIGILNKINEAIKSFDYSNDETENENEVPPIDSKYYNIKDFNAQNFNPLKQFSILHLNIHSVELHIEEFRIILQLLNLKFDFICITE